MISITLTNEEAVAFKLFRQHQDMFCTLLESGMHQLSNGTATISFDSDGTLRKIRLEQVVYKA